MSLPPPVFAHTPWDGSHPLFRIGLSPGAGTSLVEPDRALADYLVEKDRLLADHRDAVFLAEEGTGEAQQESLDRLLADATRHHGDIWRVKDGRVHVEPAGRSIDPAGDAPLVQAARLFQEDLVIMRKGAEGWRLAAACVCFPSSWSLGEKFGRPMARIHAPVPGFGPGSRNAMLIERIFDNLPPGDTVQRMNWSLYGDDRLYHGDERSERRRGSRLEDIFLRVERQTLTRLIASRDILFTIRIHLTPAVEITLHPDQARLASGLAASLRRLDGPQLAYKGLAADRDILLDQLDRLAACS